MLNFPGSSSKQMLHYIDIHVEDKSIDTVLLHVGVNDLLNDNSKSNVDNLMSNIHKIVEKCKRVGVRNIFVSGLVYTTRVSLPILERVHSLISNYCRENACFYIDNINNKNPMIGYLNIISLRNKLTDLRVILKYLSLDYFVLSETKLDESFPNAQFTLDGYEIRTRKDRNKFGGSLIEYVRKGLICKRTAKYERKSNECICSEINF